MPRKVFSFQYFSGKPESSSRASTLSRFEREKHRIAEAHDHLLVIGVIAELAVRLEYVVHHETGVLVRIGGMLAVLGEDLAKNVNDVASLGHRQFDVDIFQAYVRIETADLLQGFPPEHQGGRHRARLAVQEQVIEVETAERQVAFALLLTRHDPAIGVDDLDIARADTYLGLVPHVCHLFLQALRQHDVVRTERHDEISRALAIASLSVFDSPWFCWTLRSKPYFAWSPRKSSTLPSLEPSSTTSSSTLRYVCAATLAMLASIYFSWL